MNAQTIESIKRAAQSRKYGVIDRYIDKMGGDEAVREYLEEAGKDSVDFRKDVMVEVEGTWYRCHCTLSCGLTEHDADNDPWTQPSSWTERDYDCHVRGITDEDTRRLIYGKN